MKKKIKIFFKRNFLYKSTLIFWIYKYFKFFLPIRKKLTVQLGFAEKYKSKVLSSNDKSKKIIIPLLETNHYQYLQILILAKALELRGADVSVLLCNSMMDGCEIKNSESPFKNQCLTCLFNHKHFIPLFKLNIITLSDFVNEDEILSIKKIAEDVSFDYPKEYYYDGIDIIPMVTESVVRYYYGNVPESLDDIAELRRRHIYTAILNIRTANKMQSVFQPDIIFNNMCVYSAWEPYYKYFETVEKTSLFTLSISAYNYNSVIFNSFELYKDRKRYNNYINNRINKKLSAPEKKKLNKFISKRHDGSTKQMKDYGWFEETPNIKKIININEHKRNIFLFPNVFWDVGLTRDCKLFPDVPSWVLKTIELINNDCHLYIKTHPAEKYGSLESSKGIKNFIEEKYPKLPTNITILEPELNIKPYDLFKFADLGIIHSGTLSVEMILEGVPVVMTSPLSPISGLGLAHEPTTLQEYKNILIGNKEPINPNTDEVELFAYFYFIKTGIPWNLTNTAYANSAFYKQGYSFQSLNDLLPGKDKYLDHLCNCILDYENIIPESWSMNTIGSN